VRSSGVERTSAPRIVRACAMRERVRRSDDVRARGTPWVSNWCVRARSGSLMREVFGCRKDERPEVVRVCAMRECVRRSDDARVRETPWVSVSLRNAWNERESGGSRSGREDSQVPTEPAWTGALRVSRTFQRVGRDVKELRSRCLTNVKM